MKLLLANKHNESTLFFYKITKINRYRDFLIKGVLKFNIHIYFMIGLYYTKSFKLNLDVYVQIGHSKQKIVFSLDLLNLSHKLSSNSSYSIVFHHINYISLNFSQCFKNSPSHSSNVSSISIYLFVLV